MTETGHDMENLHIDSGIGSGEWNPTECCGEGVNGNGRRDVLPDDVPLDCMETIAEAYGIDFESIGDCGQPAASFVLSHDATMVTPVDPSSGPSIAARHVLPTPMGFEEDSDMSPTKWREALGDYMPGLSEHIEDASRELVIRAIESMGNEGRGGEYGISSLLDEGDETAVAALSLLTDGMAERLCGFLTMEVAKIADTRIRAWYAGDPDNSDEWWNGGSGDEKMAGTMLENQISAIYHRDVKRGGAGRDGGGAGDAQADGTEG